LKVAVILNGISLRKNFLYHDILPALNKSFEVEVFETLSQNDATLLASKAVEKRFDVILAAGGDGTVHQVLNGILHDRENSINLPTLGIIPIGSGNDFARALKLIADKDQIINLVKDFKPKKLDVGKISFRNGYQGEESFRYFINEVDIGMGPEVVKKVMSSDRPFGAAISYYMAILSTFATFKPLYAKIKTSTWCWEGKISTLAIANGNYYGHGLCISPDSKPNDRKFGTFICSWISVFDFIRYSNDLKKGKYVRIPEISYNEADSIELSSPNPCVVEADGEILGYLPSKIEMIERQLAVLY
jgi:YegS/Rv2252/BmrU family lipid kinase